MTNIIVVLPKLEEAKGVKNILVRSGFQVTGICTTGTQAISQADGLNAVSYTHLTLPTNSRV